MKLSYTIIIGLLFVFLILWILLPSIEEIEAKIQGAGFIVALLAAVIALSVTDKKIKKIRTEIKNIHIKNLDQEIYINKSTIRSMSDISESEIKERYKKFSQPIKFYIVEFEIINKSKFDWKIPSFTYETPIDQRYLNKIKENEYEEHLPHTNYHLYGTSKTYWYVSGDMDIFSSTKLPYINKDKSLKVWFTLFLDTKIEKFTINMSVNCDAVEGTTKEIEINPSRLLENFNKNN